jgi:hypothetical protein
MAVTIQVELVVEPGGHGEDLACDPVTVTVPVSAAQ